MHEIETPAERVAGEVGDEVEYVGDEFEDWGRHVLSIIYQDIANRDGYLIVLIMVLLTIVVTPIGDDVTGGAVLNAVMLALLVLTTLSRSHVSRSVRIFGAVVTLSAVIVAIAGAINGRSVSTGTTTPDPEWLYALGTSMYTLVLALCFPAILRQAFTHRRVSLNTVAASLSAYLLLGLIFAAAYRFIQVVDPPFFLQRGANSFTFVYFSYVTLTTVGYGDYTAASNGGRAVAILEALFGQVFLVTIVALVVSNLGRDREPVRRDARAPRRPRTRRGRNREASGGH
jgi:voltage-gated potassium channel Kch